jgi:formate hydrogenlyase subunit 6/NADH:ubiquinone oxidoreductase subunit I
MINLFGEAMKNLLGRRFTRQYPKQRPPLPEGLRGKVQHFREKCIYCGLCAKYCPSNAITVDIKNKEWNYNWGQCLFCGQCEEVCHLMPRKDAIKLTKEFEMADRDRNKFVLKD